MTEIVRRDMSKIAQPPVHLIVNADDYGYFPCVSRGIAAAARLGAVTATGILANCPKLDEQIEWLRPFPRLDRGVHLNLTSGFPLSSAMTGKLGRWKGQFPGVFAMAGSIQLGRIGVAEIRAEWRAQIARCREYGGPPAFLNSHEHIHMLPGLFALALELVEEFQIPHVRVTCPEWFPRLGPSILLRNTLLQGMRWLQRRSSPISAPRLLGLNQSGHLTLRYFERLLPKLRPGQVYELMCHPGHFEPQEISNSKLLSYHAWQSEFEVLTSPALQSLFRRHGVRLIPYHELNALRGKSNPAASAACAAA